MSDQPTVLHEKRVQLTTKAAVTIVGVGVVAIVLRKKYNVKIEAAKQAGVDEWLLEMHSQGSTILTLPKALAETFFSQTMEMAQK